MNTLKKSMGGVSWKFDDEMEESKKVKKSKVAPKEQVKTAQKRVEKENDLGMER